MILLGYLATLKDNMYKSYFPDLTTSAVLNNVQFTRPQTSVNTIRGVRSRLSFGRFSAARKPFELTFNFTTSSEIAHQTFLSVLLDLQKVTGGYVLQPIDSFSVAGFIPISISSVGWNVQGYAPAQYNITYQYFHLDGADADAQPLISSIFDFTDTEIEIDLQQVNKRPIESLSFSLTGQYETLRTLDGYKGIRFENFNLSQSVNYFDDTYEYTFPYSVYVDSNSQIESVNTSTSIEGKRVWTKSIQGLLLPSSSEQVITSLPFGG